ncbi:MAG: HAD family acid phosphatase [Polyangiaceae bacterium]|jgi:acid phosphatase
MPLFGPNTVRVDTQHIHLIRLLRGYHDDGEYEQDIRSVGELALRCVKDAPANCPSPAIVFDIDETSLANDWPRLLRPEARAAAGDRFSYYDQSHWNALVERACAPPVQATLDVYRLTRSLGWTIFFITGRPDTQREATEKNLVASGYAGWARVVMRDEGERTVDASIYKSAARKRITEAGHTILVNIGDQASDLSGGFAAHTFKLPNPFYFVP